MDILIMNMYPFSMMFKVLFLGIRSSVVRFRFECGN